MAQVLATIQAVLGMLPVLIQLINLSEAALGPGTGAAKLEMVKTLLQKAMSLTTNVTLSIDHVWPFVEPLISSYVGTLKAKGQNPG